MRTEGEDDFRWAGERVDWDATEGLGVVTTMDRPRLTRSLPAAEFAAWYWLKQELAAFCRRAGLATGGSKLELAERITAYLLGELPVRRAARRGKAGRMPAEFAPGTVIGAGWRCNPALGAYLRGVCGEGFRFNAAMREFIHTGAGRTLAEAALCYQVSVRPGAPKTEIAPQLEYNRHFREYFREHPGATRERAIEAWWVRRGERRERDS